MNIFIKYLNIFIYYYNYFWKGHEKLILREISILHKLDHKNIIKLYDVFETDKHIILQTE